MSQIYNIEAAAGSDGNSGTSQDAAFKSLSVADEGNAPVLAASEPEWADSRSVISTNQPHPLVP
ncbi:MAG: hypothetical protein ABI377_12740 [Devosia sp.]